MLNVTVLLASGDEDEWENVGDAVVDMDLGGALCIYSSPEEIEGQQVMQTLARYAPGMWMKVEYAQ